MQPCEKEFFRKDGSRVPVLIGAAAFDGQPNQGVAYILDLTIRKRAEEAARQSEQRYRQVQAELAHANRVATMGQLTGSIAHEVNQPIAATIIGASAALRWLQREPANLEEVRQALDQIVKDGTRAGDVISRIRDLIKKVPLDRMCCDISGLIRDTIELTHGEATKHSVSVKVGLAEGLPLIRGDRVQLQQVILNLIVNAIEAMDSVDENARKLVISVAEAESGDLLVVVRIPAPVSHRYPQSVFRALLHNEDDWFGHGLVALPFDHRSTQRATVGYRERTVGYCTSVQLAAMDAKHRARVTSRRLRSSTMMVATGSSEVDSVRGAISLPHRPGYPNNVRARLRVLSSSARSQCLSNRSRASQNGNWKTTPRDWRHTGSISPASSSNRLQETGPGQPNPLKCRHFRHTRKSRH